MKGLILGSNTRGGYLDLPFEFRINFKSRMDRLEILAPDYASAL